MERDSSQTLYTVALTGIRDQRSQMKLAQTLSSVSGRLPMETVMKRLNALPWTLTRKASFKRAYRLVKLLESLGGEVQCVPPLPTPSKPLMDETQILPGAELISQTQIMSATQFVSLPDEPSPSASVSVPKLERGPKVAPETSEPSEVETEDGQPQGQQSGEDVKVGFFAKHIRTFVIALVAAAVTLASVGLALYILDRLGLIS